MFPAAPTPRERFNMGRVIGRVVSLYRSNAVPVTVLAAILAGGVWAAASVVQGYLFPIDTSPSATTASAFTSGFWGGYFKAAVVSLFTGYLQLVVCHRVINQLDGHAVPLSASMVAGLRAYPSYFGARFVSGIAAGFALILLIVPGVILLLMWSMIAPVIVLEKSGFSSAMGRSEELTRGSRVHIFGLYMLQLVIGLVSSAVLGAVIALVAGPAATKAVELVATPLAEAFIAIILSLGMASTYYELRHIREGGSSVATAAVFT